MSHKLAKRGSKALTQRYCDLEIRQAN